MLAESKHPKLEALFAMFDLEYKPTRVVSSTLVNIEDA